MTCFAARRLASLATLAVAAALPSTGQSQTRSGDSVVVARLVRLGRVFGAVKYFHPAFLERNVPWDSAIAVAVEGAIAAKTDAEYLAVITSLLESLGDPMTRVVKETSPKSVASPQLSKRWDVSGGDSILVFSIPDFENWQGVMELMASALPDARRGTPIVFDLRGPERSEQGEATFVFGSSPLTTLLPVAPVAAPAVRRRMHNGFTPQSGGTSGGYWSGTYEVSGTTIAVRTPNKSRRVVFLVNPWSEVPPVAYALRTTGQSAIVVDGDRVDLRSGGLTYDIELMANVKAAVRIGTMAVDARADTSIAADDGGSSAMRAALGLARAPVSPAKPAPITPSSYVPQPEASYPAMRYPTTGYRVLAAYRFWTAINYFFPYKHLIGEGWDATWPRSIRLMLAARDSLEYALAAAEMATYLHDSHGSAISATFVDFIGRATVGLQLQYIGGQPVVIAVAEDSATKASGIAVGDIILSVDGEDAAVRRTRIAKYIAHSTPQALDAAVAGRLFSGPDSSIARLRVRDRQDKVRELLLPRRISLYQLIAEPRTGPIMKMLPGNIGYADLARLTVPAVDTMFERFKDTKAIILDGRGYPRGTAWAIAPRLTEKETVAAAAFQRPIVLSPDSTEWTTYQFMQYTPRTTKPRYKGRTVMLMDEHTISQAEHTGLFFEAANKTVFIGSPTMGANGDVTTVVLPGGITARFSGHDVRHADGRQLQRLGLQPHVAVRPTLAGVRAGRDEVLEKALEFLRK